MRPLCLLLALAAPVACAGRTPVLVTTAGDDTSIPIFPDIQIGIDATAATLLSSRAYSAILWTLSEGTATCDAFALGVMASPWAASHYGGDPSHFCGNSGDGGTPGVGVTACLRLRDRAAGAVRRAQRMPGACDGHVTGAAGHGRRGSGRHQRAGAIPARGHPHVTRLPAAPPRQRPGGHRAPLRAAGTVRHRR